MQITEQEKLEELEALQAIYGDDYIHRPKLWNLPSFSINLRSTNEVKSEIKYGSSSSSSSAVKLNRTFHRLLNKLLIISLIIFLYISCFQL